MARRMRAFLTVWLLLSFFWMRGRAASFEWDSPDPGACSVAHDDETGDLYFQANACRVDLAVREISRIVGVEIEVFNDVQRELTCRYGPVSLEQLLDRMGLAYGLIYEENEAGTMVLKDAVMLRVGVDSHRNEFARYMRELVQNLYDDDIRWNAIRAADELWPMGSVAVPYLEEAFLQGDCQARNYAGMILCTTDGYTNPPPQILNALFYCLSGDDLGSDREARCVNHRDERWVIRYFEKNVSLIEILVPSLAGGLSSTDGQMRFLCAYLLSLNKHWEYAAQMCPIFVAHLRDNRLGGDATISAYMLTAMGNVARPWVIPFLESDDEQQRKYAKLIVFHIDNPSAGPQKTGMHEVIHDPAVEQRSLHIRGWRPERFPDVNGQYRIESKSENGGAQAEDHRFQSNAESHSSVRDPRVFESVSVSDQTFRYDVLEADTLNGIAHMFGITPDDILSVNPDLQIPLRGGDRLTIPVQ